MKYELCGSVNQDSAITVCNVCGYNFQKREISDKDSLQAYLVKLTKSDSWIEPVKLKNRLNDIQIRRYGHASTNLKITGWSERETAKLLEETNSTKSTDIRLVEGFEEYPQLLKCKNKTEAKKRFREIQKGVTYKGDKPTFEFEKNLQKYLSLNWNKTPFFKEWELQKADILREGHYDTGEIGELDLLAKHRKDQRWLIIELKRDQSSDETVGQILRYMVWVKENLAADNGEVEGIIISETANERIRYALQCIPNITLQVYRFENGQLVFKNSSFTYFDSEIKKMSPKQAEQLIKELENKNLL